MTATSYLRKKIVDLITGNAAYVPPAIYLSLHAGDPGQSGSHTLEVAAGGYARQALAGKMSEANPVTGISTNTAVINFGPATEDWPTITYLGIEDAATSGNMLAPGIPSNPKTIYIGQPFQIPPGNLRIRLT